MYIRNSIQYYNVNNSRIEKKATNSPNDLSFFLPFLFDQDERFERAERDNVK